MNIHLALLYVADPARSVAFYTALLGAPPVEHSENFAMFKTQGAALGLWARHDVDPPALAAPGCCELDWTVSSPAEVDRIHAEWRARDVSILQAPTDKEFGRTFLAADPDGHRLRVLCPAG